MKIQVRNDNPLVVNGQAELVKLATSAYSLIFVSKKYKLQPKELDFFVGCVLAWHNSIDIGSTKFIDYMKNDYIIPYNKRVVYNLRYILTKKKWLKPTGDTLDIPDLFKSNINSLSINLLVKS